MKLIVQDLATEYADEGKGPVILLLHGWQDDLHTFDSVVKELSGYRVVRLDLPGFGGTEPPAQPWTLHEYVEFVATFIQKLDLSVTTLAGHSFGGRIAIKGISTGALKPAKLVLIASAGIAKNKTPRARLLKMAAKTGKVATYLPPLVFWRKELRQKLYKHAGSDYLAAGPLQATFIHVIREDLRAAAAKLSVPALLIWGGQDTATPVADAKILASLIKGSSLEVLPQAGHFVHREQARQVAKLIKEFAK